MKLFGVIIPLDDLFKLDIHNHNSLLGGFMGFAHALLSSIALAHAWFLTILWSLNPFASTGLMVAVWFLTNLWWLNKETKGFTVSLFAPRSTPLVTLDTRMDFFNALFWSSVILVAWFYLLWRATQ